MIFVFFKKLNKREVSIFEPSIGSNASNFLFSNNIYFDGSNWRYDQNGYGAQIQTETLSVGVIAFNTFASGTAGNVATIIESMRIVNNGNILMGDTNDLGFKLYTTQGTHDFLRENGVDSALVRKHSQGRGPAGEFTAVDLITEGIVGLVINTPLGRGTRMDGWRIRTAAIQRGVPCITTIAGFKAAVAGISELQGKSFGIQSIQEWLAIVE